MGAIREHVGAAEDRFLATVFLGSGLVFTATMFAAAAAAGAVLSVGHPAGTAPSAAYWDFGRHFAYTMMVEYAMRMAAVFVSAVSAIGHRLGVLPRRLTALGGLTALTLLFVSSNVPWSELVFPAWSLFSACTSSWPAVGRAHVPRLGRGGPAGRARRGHRPDGLPDGRSRRTAPMLADGT
ncbi:hypothetical protein [Streptomyces puniciscabiei]|uniref:hypothetical protein n=1 Tax=Streptomyces puniciscabiei TaxID=164348 RepID=UPI00333182FA